MRQSTDSKMLRRPPSSRTREHAFRTAGHDRRPILRAGGVHGRLQARGPARRARHHGSPERGAQPYRREHRAPAAGREAGQHGRGHLATHGSRRPADRARRTEQHGADFLPAFKPYFVDGRTLVASAHKAYGPERDDLAKRLRGAGVSQVVLAGMSANLCVESHLRALLESGFEVAVVEDATAAAALDEGDGYQAALVNFRYIADALWSTDEALRQI